MVSEAVPLHRLSVDDVLAMVAAGVLDEDDRVELVEGVLVEMVPIGPEHDGAVAWLTRQFAAVASDAWEVRVQSTLLVAGGYLLPDLMLVERLPRSEHPASALLVIETAQTSQVRDREKARDYARANVREYWIVDLAARAVEVHRLPRADGYEDVTTFGAGQSVSPLVSDAPAVDVSALMG